MHFIRLFTSIFVVSVLASCASARFEKDWKTAVADQSSGKGDPVSGPWAGSWTTETNGHTGKLRCLVTPLHDAACQETNGKKLDDQYRFRYHATWGKIFQGGYTADYDVKKSGSGYQVTGSKDLGPFGEFKHDGKIQGDQFNATYESTKGDKGGFYLNRPK